MSQTTTCLCILSFVTLLGCSEEPATVYPDGGRITTARDAGGNPAGGTRPDGGLDAGRDAGRGGRDAEPENEDDEDGDDEAQGAMDAGTGGRADAFEVTSPDFGAGDVLPAEYSCEDAVSPALSWSPGPEGTLSYAVQLRDTAREAPLKSFWVLFDLPADVTELPRDLPKRPTVTRPAARQALNDNRMGEYGYFGPCSNASLELTVHALSVEELPDVTDESSAEEVAAAIAEHELGKATLEARAVSDEEP